MECVECEGLTVRCLRMLTGLRGSARLVPLEESMIIPPLFGGVPLSPSAWCKRCSFSGTERFLDILCLYTCKPTQGGKG